MTVRQYCEEHLRRERRILYLALSPFVVGPFLLLLLPEVVVSALVWLAIVCLVVLAWRESKRFTCPCCGENLDRLFFRWGWPGGLGEASNFLPCCGQSMDVECSDASHQPRPVEIPHALQSEQRVSCQVQNREGKRDSASAMVERRVAAGCLLLVLAFAAAIAALVCGAVLELPGWILLVVALSVLLVLTQLSQSQLRQADCPHCGRRFLLPVTPGSRTPISRLFRLPSGFRYLPCCGKSVDEPVPSTGGSGGPSSDATGH